MNDRGRYLLLQHWAKVALEQATEGARLLKALEHDEPPHYLTRPVPCPIGTPYGTVLRMRDHGLVVVDPPGEYGWCRVRLAPRLTPAGREAVRS